MTDANCCYYCLQMLHNMNNIGVLLRTTVFEVKQCVLYDAFEWHYSPAFSSFDVDFHFSIIRLLCFKAVAVTWDDGRNWEQKYSCGWLGCNVIQPLLLGFKCCCSKLQSISWRSFVPSRTTSVCDIWSSFMLFICQGKTRQQYSKRCRRWGSGIRGRKSEEK